MNKTMCSGRSILALLALCILNTQFTLPYPFFNLPVLFGLSGLTLFQFVTHKQGSCLVKYSLPMSIAFIYACTFHDSEFFLSLTIFGFILGLLHMLCIFAISRKFTPSDTADINTLKLQKILKFILNILGVSAVLPVQILLMSVMAYENNITLKHYHFLFLWAFEILSLTPFCTLLYFQNKKLDFNFKFITLWVPLFVSALLICQISQYEGRRAYAAAQQLLIDEMSVLKHNLFHKIESNYDTLYSLRNFYLSSEFVDENEFNNFILRDIYNNPEIHSIQWTPIILKGKEQIFLDSIPVRQDTFPPELHIESSNNTELSFYAPIFYISPVTFKAHEYLFDIATDSHIYELLIDAAIKDDIFFSGSTKIGKLPENGSFLLCTIPVSKGIYQQEYLPEFHGPPPDGYYTLYCNVDVLLSTTVRHSLKNFSDLIFYNLTSGIPVEISRIPLKPKTFTTLHHPTTVVNEIQLPGIKIGIEATGSPFSMTPDTYLLKIFLISVVGFLLFTTMLLYFVSQKEAHEIEREREISELKIKYDQSKEKIIENEKRLSLAIMGTQNAVFEWTKDTDSLIVSDHLFIDGHSVKKLADLKDYLFEDDFKLMSQALNSRVLATDHNIQFEFRWIDKYGHITWYTMKAQWQLDENQKPSKIVGLWFDISERKQAEEKLKEAVKISEHASQTKSRFLANMSHELRTPLNGILGLVNILQSGDLTSHQLEYLNNIDTCGNHLLEILNDILDLSKIEAGKHYLSEEKFRLDSMLKTVIVPISVLSSNKNLEFKLEIDESIPDVVIGDSVKLKQILMNLLGNAVKFTLHGFISLSVTHEKIRNPIDSDEILLTFTIKDSGIGMDSVQLKEIFSPFVQVHKKTTYDFQGTGLGTSISKNLIELMGGTISVSSTPNIGTEMVFSVPLKNPTSDLYLICEEVTSDETVIGQQIILCCDETWHFNHLHEKAQTWGTEIYQIKTDVELEKWIKNNRSKLPSKDPDIIFLFHHSYLDAYSCNLDSILNTMSSPHKLIVCLPDDNNTLPQSLNFLNSSSVYIDYSEFSDIKCIDYIFGQLQATSDHHLSLTIWSHIKILIAEDNTINQLIIKKNFEKLNLHCTVVENGQELVTTFQQNKYDIIISDLRMPIMDGFEACREIRKINPRIPFIALTASITDDMKQECYLSGMNDFLVKPVSHEQLLNVIKKYGKMETSGWNESGIIETAGENPPESLFHIDRSKALMNLDHDRSLYFELIQTFIQTFPNICHEISHACTQNNHKEFLRHVHSLKSTMAVFGAYGFENYTAKLEAYVTANPSISLSSVAQDFLKSLQSIYTHLSKMPE